MIIETWESILRQRGDIERANKVAGFRERFGDVDLPRQRLGYDLALVEMEDRMNQLLPWAPPASRHFIAQMFHRNEEYTPPRNYKPRDLSVDQWVKRAQAVMYGFWGTAARVDEVAEGFSLLHASTVRHILDRYINYSYLAHLATRFDYSLWPTPLFKLKQAVAYSPREDVEEIKAFDDIWIYLQRRYLPEVDEIVDHLEKDRVVIIDGPFGIGKTFNLQHQTHWRFLERGYLVYNVDGQIYRTASRILSSWDSIWEGVLNRDQSKLFIIDEAPALVLSEGGVREEALEENENLMRRIQSEKMKLFLINATRSADLRQVVFEHFQAIWQKLGREVVRHNVRQVHVPPELARQDLIRLGANSNLIDFFLRPENIALLNTRLYYLHRGDRNIEELKKNLQRSHFLQSTSTWMAYLLSGQGGSKEDFVRMLTNLGILQPHHQDLLEQIPDY